MHDEDLDPALNPNALYFVEGQYVTLDEATAHNGENSNSYRPIRFIEPSPTTGPCRSLDPNEFCAITTGSTERERPAIGAWRDHDPTVEETEVRVPGEGLFMLATKAIDLKNGFWRYEYAIQNINSDRSARSFTIPLPKNASVQGIGFHDVDYHSGEPFDPSDWLTTVTTQSITWSTDLYDTNTNANALRWGSLYNFWFEAAVEPFDITAVLGLFKPGFPTTVPFATTGPDPGLIDCNGNDVADNCDVSCDAPDCQSPSCGQSTDCNGNNVPDECEPDCNENNIVDACDVVNCPPEDLTCTDCNNNLVPDSCEVPPIGPAANDCNSNGIPDICELIGDCDEDGVDDCADVCPCVNEPGVCVCPEIDRCCFPILGICFEDVPRHQCLASKGGVPDCVSSPCHDGCLVGDLDQDGDLDLRDSSMLLDCFSGPHSDSGFVAPSASCLFGFDVDDDGDIDGEDAGAFFSSYDSHAGP